MKLANWLRVITGLVIYPVMVFIPAGTVNWTEGWIFLGISMASVFLTGSMLYVKDPELLRERTDSMFRKDQKSWDKIWIALFLLCTSFWLPLAGLDAVRFGWSHMALWLKYAGGALYTLALIGMHFVFMSNPFLSPVVRIQKDREHKVIDTGPYAIVRHPMYATTVPLFFGASLLLGSWCAVGLSALMIAMLAFRIVLEEKVLRQELPGYDEYTARVKYRLLPGIW